MARRLSLLFVVLVLVASVGSAASLTGCVAQPESGETTEATETAQATKPAKPEVPPPPMLRDVRGAIYSYMVWISYAYRILDSEPAYQMRAFSDFEEVRVNSYVQLNKQEARAIDQTVTEFELKSVETRDNTATASVVESWRYRYIDVKTGLYTGPWREVTYDSTYTVVKHPKYGWQVDEVEAAPRSEVP